MLAEVVLVAPDVADRDRNHSATAASTVRLRPASPENLGLALARYAPPTTLGPWRSACCLNSRVGERAARGCTPTLVAMCQRRAQLRIESEDRWPARGGHLWAAVTGNPPPRSVVLDDDLSEGLYRRALILATGDMDHSIADRCRVS